MSGAPTGWQDPRTTWLASHPITTTDLNRIEGNTLATELGNRTLDQALPAPANTGTLRQILSWFAGRIRAITGATNWWDVPATTLAAASTHHGAVAPHTGHVLRTGDTMTGTLTAPDVRWGIDNSRGIHLPSGIDLNTVITAGWYNVGESLNRPADAGSWIHLIVSRGHSPLWVWQLVHDLFSDRMWTRRSFDSASVRVWAPWREIENVAGAQAKVDTHATAIGTHTHPERHLTVSHTLTLSDTGRVLTFDSAAALVLTIPTHAEAPLLLGTQLLVHRLGVGAVTISPAVGVTLNSAGGARSVRLQFGFAGLIKRGDNVWSLGGDLI
ncbi:MAG: hypothetical protein DDT20_01842 [Firmicutes bacterium]|nr:hypothetical protein [Bacillota bacterium]